MARLIARNPQRAKLRASGSMPDLSNYYTKGETNALLQKKADVSSVPTATSDLLNDSGFITKLVDDLTNYYKKTETYSKNEVDARISLIPKFKIEVVDALPTEDISDTTVYLLRNEDEESGNLYDEYIYVNDDWELLGSQRIDLTGYATETWTIGQIATATANCLKEPSSGLAVGKYFRVASIDSDGHAVLEACDPPSAPVQSISTATGILTPDANGNVLIPYAIDPPSGTTYYGPGLVYSATTYQISNWRNDNDRRNYVVPINYFDFAVKCAMTDGVGAAWTDAERLAALLRMGCTVDSNGFVKWTAQS